MEGLQVPNTEFAKKAVISLSGGLDSTMLLMELFAQGIEEVHAYSFSYGQKHSIELKKVKKNVKFLQAKGFNILHQIIDLKDAFSDSASSLHEGGEEIPQGHYDDSNMKSTVVENRNIIFSAIVYAKALGWANKTGENVFITLGLHAGDHCFTKDTKILTPNGYKTIDKIKIGDKVYSVDPVNQKAEVDTITNALKTGQNDEIYEIDTTTGSIRLTSDHKVYVADEGINSIGQKMAKELVEGDILISPCDLKGIDPDKIRELGLVDKGTTKIKSIKISHEMEDVYDITVEKNHNFFAGEYGNILIHNCIYPDCRPESQAMAKELFRISNWGSEKIDYIAPFEYIDKGKVLEAGLESMEVLGFTHAEMKKVLKNTHTCYNPNEKGESCGRCGSCDERRGAFKEVCTKNRWKWLKKDPIPYAN